MSSTFCSTARIARGDKTGRQVRAIFGLAKARELNDDELRAVVEEVTGQRHISALSRHDADKVIGRLGGTPLTTPRRTVQHRRQRAGVPQLATPAHLDLMHSLARRRGMADSDLEQLSVRQCGHYPPRTTAETNSVIEALKSMNRRDGLL
jgi:hypothetical protein